MKILHIMYHITRILIIIYLVKKYCNEKVIDEECFRRRSVVVLEEKEGEGEDQVLFGAVRKGTAEHLHATQHHQQRAQAEKKNFYLN